MTIEMRKWPTRKVIILNPATIPWLALCLGGIRSYAQAHGGWHLFSSPPTPLGPEEAVLTLRSMRGWKGDAIIVVSNDENELRYAREIGVPVVNLAGGLSGSSGVPRVMVNHHQAGRLAAEHLLGRGLRHLAFFGWKDLWYSEQRRLGFTERAAEAGVTCELLLRAAREESSQSWPERMAGIAAWLTSLHRPSGVFAVHDYRAQLLIEVCQETDLRVPDDIAVIGMDDDKTVCEHCVPTLTSVSRNGERVGWEAAALLDRMMQGERPPSGDLFLEPDGVVARQSTDILYCAEPVAQRALDYMRSHLKTPFNVEQVAEHVGVSKRTLEMRFRGSLQSSPHDFLTRLRVQHAQGLMQTPHKFTTAKTALECGFGSVPAFCAAFHRLTGESPASFRRKQLVRKAAASPV